ncbi:MAG: methyltransferase domain-containing protein [Deltaproteobacteria bacterium]|nr:methyltransferase domain-containing protein [Deltaproteobacteria bacterium]
MHTKHGIRRNFARRAATYDAHARVQRLMADELLRLIGDAVTQAQKILEIGCGTGYLTRALRCLNPQAWLVAVDLDGRLIRTARNKLNGDHRTTWLVADGETMTRGAFNLIISNSTFQWFCQPGETLKTCAERLTPGGTLAFAAMGPRTFHELGASLKIAEAGRASPVDIPAAGFLGRDAWEDLLKQAGFVEVCTAGRLLVLDFPSVRDFLKSIQATGATNPHPRPFSSRVFQAMLAAYQERFAKNGSIPASYELIWALARK